jgi:hypothetical protein
MQVQLLPLPPIYMKKIIIAGSRNLEVSPYLIEELFIQFRLPFKNVEVVSGKCPTGIDLCGEKFAEIFELPVKPFPADWDKHGRAAGPMRNKLMASYADVLLLIWNGESAGSENMQQQMLRVSKPVFETILSRS